MSNLEVVAIVIGIMLFAMVFYILNKTNIDRGASVLIAIVLSILVSWNLYTNRFYGGEVILILIITLFVLAIVIRISWGILRFMGRSLGIGKVK